MEHRLPLLRRLAELARRPRSGRRPGEGPRGRALGGLPLLAGALARGELSYAKVRALTRVATPETEARLLAVGRAGTAAHVERIVRGWRRVDRLAETREAARQHAGRSLTVYHDEDGMVVVRGRLEPDLGALLLRALDAAREALHERTRGEAAAGAVDLPLEEPPPVQRQADALALLAETALHQGLDPGPLGDRYQVVVHVDAAVLADPDRPGQPVVEDGARVSAETSRRLACDASRVVIRHDAVVPRRFEGPPGAAHGGIVAAYLDEVLGAAMLRATGRSNVTGELTVRHVAPVPLETPLLGHGRLVTDHGRYVDVEGRLGPLRYSNRSGGIRNEGGVQTGA